VLPFVAVALLVLLAVAAVSVDLANSYRAQRHVQTAGRSSGTRGDLRPAVQQQQCEQGGGRRHGRGDDPAQRKLECGQGHGHGDRESHPRGSAPAPAVAGHGQRGVKGGYVPADPALFAYNTACDASNGIQVSGANNTFTGGIHSNGTFNSSGSGNSFGSHTTYGGPNSCSDAPNHPANSYGRATGPTVDGNTEPWPFDPRNNLPACTYSAPSLSLSTSKATIPSGVYCATDQIAIPASSLTGNVTFITPKLSITGSNERLKPYWHGLFAYSSGTAEVDITAGSLDDGTIFAPNATIQITGGNSASSGFVEALNVHVAASGWRFTGSGPLAVHG
jgi:hypothetical protein